MMHALRFFFSFFGRINRAQYWFGWMILMMLAVAVVGPVILLNEEPPDWAMLTVFACGLVLSISSYALAVRRLHDIDLSGWYLPLAIVLWPVLGFPRGTRGENRFGDDP